MRQKPTTAKIDCTCQHCGTHFQKYPSTIKGGRGMYCSFDCRCAAQRKRVDCTCAHCGAAFQLQASQVRASRGGTYCSRKCFGLAHTVKSALTCAHCGDQFVAHGHWIDKRIYCSSTCHGLANRQGGSARYLGERVLNSSGYVLIDDPSGKGRVLEHRLVMERHVGQMLRTDEHVHHINGIKDDNRIENLQVMDAAEHAALHAHDLWARRRSDGV